MNFFKLILRHKKKSKLRKLEEWVTFNSAGNSKHSQKTVGKS